MPGTHLMPAAGADTYQKSFPGRLNTTGRTLDLPMPLTDGKQLLGEVIVRLAPDDSVQVHSAGLTEKLSPILNDRTRLELTALTGTHRVVTLDALSDAGFDIRFDRGLQELVFQSKIDQRPVNDINFGSYVAPAKSANLARPALAAGYLNIIGGIDHIWGGRSHSPFATNTDDTTLGRLELESALRIWNIVLENRALYKTEGEASLCRSSAHCFPYELSGFMRQSSRLIYDRPADSLRIATGDVEPLGLGIQGMPDVLGLSVEKSPKTQSWRKRTAEPAQYVPD